VVFDGFLLTGTVQVEDKTEPIFKPVKVGAMIEYEVSRRRIVPRVSPTISGMQQACEFALMLISNEPRRIKPCRLAGCKKYFNTQTSGQRFFCTRKHAIAHEETEKIRRTNKSRGQTV
jgi:hypothetical protein